MKSRTLPEPFQPPHISPVSVQSPLIWNEQQKFPARCRLLDSYNFIMDLINADPHPVKNTVKKAKPVSGKLTVTYGDAWPPAEAYVNQDDM